MSLSATVPALPVVDVGRAVIFYTHRLGFTAAHADRRFARLVRDTAEVHLWAADDESWRTRNDAASTPVASGAESFLAGTGSCRIEVDVISALHEEMARSGVLHPIDRGAPQRTAWGTIEFAVLDADGNLLTFHQRDPVQNDPVRHDPVSGQR